MAAVGEVKAADGGGVTAAGEGKVIATGYWWGGHGS